MLPALIEKAPALRKIQVHKIFRPQMGVRVGRAGRRSPEAVVRRAGFMVVAQHTRHQFCHQWQETPAKLELTALRNQPVARLEVVHGPRGVAITIVKTHVDFLRIGFAVFPTRDGLCVGGFDVSDPSKDGKIGTGHAAEGEVPALCRLSPDAPPVCRGASTYSFS